MPPAAIPMTWTASCFSSYDLEGLGMHAVESFEIGRYLVSNAWFAEFMAAGGV